MTLRIFTFIWISMVVFSCATTTVQSNKIPLLQYEARAMEGKVGVSGTVLFLIFSYGANSNEVIARCKRDALHAVLFRGIPGSNYRYPLIDNPDLMYEQSDYFKTFFAVKDLKTFEEDTSAIPYYLNYVVHRAEIPIDPANVTDYGAYKKMGVPVSVNIDLLLSKLTKDDIVEKVW